MHVSRSSSVAHQPNWFVRLGHRHPTEVGGISVPMLLPPANHVHPVRLLVTGRVQEPFCIETVLLDPVAGLEWACDGQRADISVHSLSHTAP